MDCSASLTGAAGSLLANAMAFERAGKVVLVSGQ